MHFSVYVKSSSTTDRSTLLLYSLRVGFEKFTGKNFALHLFNYKKLLEVTKMQ